MKIRSMDSLSTMIEANFEYMRKIGERKAESGHLYSTMPIEFFLSYPTLSKFMFFKWGHYFIGTEEFDNFSEWNIPVGLLLPKVMPNCMYRNPSSFAIDPSGDMFKYLEYLGNSQYKVGNIREKKLSLSKVARSIFIADPFDNQECLACNIFPICGGGCPIDRQKKKRRYKNRSLFCLQNNVGRHVAHLL